MPRFASRLTTALIAMTLAPAVFADSHEDPYAMPLTPSPEGAEVYFIGLKDGDTVTSPLTIRFGLGYMGVAPAGVEHANTGHHHLIINAPTPGKGEAIWMDDQHRHFGGGQTKTQIELPVGTHSLQLVMGDHNHIPHDPPVMSDRITITVTD